MFRFGQPGYTDTAPRGYYGGRPYTAPAQYGFDDFGGLFGPSRAQRRRQQQLLHHQQQQQQQQQQAALLRRKQLLLQQQAEAEAREAEEKRRRKEHARRARALQRYTAAAVVIQRAWRRYRARRRNDAALVVTRALRDAAAVARARRVVSSLRALRAQRDRVRSLTEAHAAAPWGYRANLFFADTLEKLILSLDTVPTYGDAFCRAARRDVVAEAQRALRLADVVTRTQGRAARTIQHAVRAHQAMARAETRDRAARIITRTLRALPAVRRAKKAAEELARLHSKRRRIAALRASMAEELRLLSAEVDAIEADTETARVLKARTASESAAILRALELETNARAA